MRHRNIKWLKVKDEGKKKILIPSNLCISSYIYDKADTYNKD